jgi:hypothetical protein
MGTFELTNQLPCYELLFPAIFVNDFGFYTLWSVRLESMNMCI